MDMETVAFPLGSKRPWLLLNIPLVGHRDAASSQSLLRGMTRVSGEEHPRAGGQGETDGIEGVPVARATHLQVDSRADLRRGCKSHGR